MGPTQNGMSDFFTDNYSIKSGLRGSINLQFRTHFAGVPLK